MSGLFPSKLWHIWSLYQNVSQGTLRHGKELSHFKSLHSLNLFVDFDTNQSIFFNCSFFEFTSLYWQDEERLIVVTTWGLYPTSRGHTCTWTRLSILDPSILESRRHLGSNVVSDFETFGPARDIVQDLREIHATRNKRFLAWLRCLRFNRFGVILTFTLLILILPVGKICSGRKTWFEWVHQSVNLDQRIQVSNWSKGKNTGTLLILSVWN